MIKVSIKILLIKKITTNTTLQPKLPSAVRKTFKHCLAGYNIFNLMTNNQSREKKKKR